MKKISNVIFSVQFTIQAGCEFFYDNFSIKRDFYRYNELLRIFLFFLQQDSRFKKIKFFIPSWNIRIKVSLKNVSHFYVEAAIK